MKRLLKIACVVIGLISSDVRAQVAETSLANQIEILELKLKLAEEQISQLQNENNTLRKEIAALKKVNLDDSADKEDQFAVGVVWAGAAKRSGSDKESRWALSISRRDGEKLEGAMAIIGIDGKRSEFPVTGTAPRKGNGVVVIESPQIGRAKLFARGTLRNGAVALAFSGTNPLGQKDFGAASLLPLK